ncbi:MAG: glycosyltransferase family 2 protein [Myxococcales bacterium]|nr:glycosyltransferase family 2 protein [Myxococcales bacterium]
MTALTTIVIARDEAARIDACLASVEGLGEALVVDTGSTDATAAVARGRGARVIAIPWRGFVDARRRGLAACETPWVLMLDADERADAALREAIARAVGGEGGLAQGYRIRRRTRFLGREMRHGAWGRDRPLRLFRRDAAHYADRAVHEHAEVRGPTAELPGTIEHLGDASWGDYMRKLNRYTTLQAMDDARTARRGAAIQMVARPPLIFLRDYVLKLGCLDGWPGFLLAAGSSFSQFTRWAKRWEIQHETNRAT